MSDFDSNPFADPHATSPFQDPSVQQATANSSRGLEEFNPFEDNNKQTNNQVPAPVPSQSTQPAVVSTTKDVSPPPPSYSQSSAQPAAPNLAAQEDLLKRQAELEEKAAELQRREQQLRSAQYNIRENNFPPLPKWFPVGPCFYQDFAVDIPVNFQRIVKTGFYLWLGYSVLLLVNFIVSIAYLFVGFGTTGATFGVALLYLVFFPPLSYLCWFRPLYNAFRSDSSFNFFLFFFVYFFQCIFLAFFALGITNGGACGLITSIDLMKGGPGGDKTVGRTVIGLIMLVMTLVFIALLVAKMYYLVQVHRLYRSSGASWEKAQQEFAKNVATNKGVQSATKQAASAAVSGAMSGAVSGNQM